MGSLHLLLNFNHGHICSEGKKQSSQKIRKKNFYWYCTMMLQMFLLVTTQQKNLLGVWGHDLVGKSACSAAWILSLAPPPPLPKAGHGCTYPMQPHGVETDRSLEPSGHPASPSYFVWFLLLVIRAAICMSFWLLLAWCTFPHPFQAHSAAAIFNVCLSYPHTTASSSCTLKPLPCNGGVSTLRA